MKIANGIKPLTVFTKKLPIRFLTEFWLHL